MLLLVLPLLLSCRFAAISMMSCGVWVLIAMVMVVMHQGLLLLLLLMPLLRVLPRCCHCGF